MEEEQINKLYCWGQAKDGESGEKAAMEESKRVNKRAKRKR